MLHRPIKQVWSIIKIALHIFSGNPKVTSYTAIFYWPQRAYLTGSQSQGDVSALPKIATQRIILEREKFLENHLSSSPDINNLMQ
jgi:hypothetical protein